MFRDLVNTRKIIVPDEGDYDVFGDGSVTMIPVPGHTPDSRVLLVKLKNTGPVILAGDLYHFVADIESKNMTRGDDRPVNLTSRAKIEALRDALSAQIWIPHDFMQFSRLAKSPHFYD
jgi:N-acyl homoserine lactone hydrolase